MQNKDIYQRRQNKFYYLNKYLTIYNSIQMYSIILYTGLLLFSSFINLI